MSTHKFTFSLSLLFLIICTSGCALIQPDASQVDNYALRIRYEQGVCFGRCPVYTLDIYDNGLVVFEGERFTDKEGTWQKVLGRNQVKELISEFETADFPNVPSAFPSNITDVSTKRLGFTPAESTKMYTTSWKDNATPQLDKLASKIRTIAEGQGYKMYDGELSKRPNIFGNIPQQATEELLIQLENGVNPEAWAVKFNTLNLQYKSKLNPNGNYYIFDADPNKTNVDDLLDILRRDDKVLSAQRNRRTSPRG